MSSKCKDLMQFFFIFATGANLQHFYKFAQIYFLCKDSSLSVTANADKKCCKNVNFQRFALVLEGHQKSTSAYNLLVFALRVKQ